MERDEARACVSASRLKRAPGRAYANALYILPGDNARAIWRAAYMRARVTHGKLVASLHGNASEQDASTRAAIALVFVVFSFLVRIAAFTTRRSR